ncbi:MAG: WecB/TagA/CpsF family glycosyltransferase [Bacillota bacterium]|nr:WecB/TagA/CpsF family glycosyltransferase [Bacillota bacterium]
MDKVSILGVNVASLTMDEAVEKINKMLSEDKSHTIYTPNSEIIMVASRDEEFKKALNQADLLTPDGIGVVKAAKILGRPIPGRVSGYDLIMRMLPELDRQGKSVFILGAKPGIAEQAAAKIKEQFNNVLITGTHDGYFDDDEEMISLINQGSPDFLMVCLGAPRQEKWIDKYKDRLNAKVIIGAGGSVDVIAGNVKRAPDFYIKHNLEWLYRVASQPKRIGRAMELPKFGFTVIGYRLKHGKKK